jgi:hypothetical protein
MRNSCGILEMKMDARKNNKKVDWSILMEYKEAKEFKFDPNRS